jgi:hypothetical protein
MSLALCRFTTFADQLVRPTFVQIAVLLTVLLKLSNKFTHRPNSDAVVVIFENQCLPRHDLVSLPDRRWNDHASFCINLLMKDYSLVFCLFHIPPDAVACPLPKSTSISKVDFSGSPDLSMFFVLRSAKVLFNSSEVLFSGLQDFQSRVQHPANILVSNR